MTLGILAALVDKSPKDLALIAPCILKVLDLILRSNDITMIESSLPTFQAFCDHHEASSLFADHVHLQQYRSIVTSYTHLASSQHVPGKAPVSLPVQMRWRTAGLDAIKHVASSDALSSVTGRQIDVIVPTVLENIRNDSDHLLDLLLDRVEAEEKVDVEKLLHRRTSIATVRTAVDTNPLAISGTALDVDKIAEDLGVLAMQCLKSIFVVPNRAQIHAATVALLKFVSQRASEGAASTADDVAGGGPGWATKVFGIVARWAPVQDRYVILLAALDTMWKTPLTGDSLGHHLALTGMIQSLLRSDINLIGLSVMDVVLGLARQIKKLFQLRLGTGQDSSSLSNDKADADKDQAACSPRRALVDRLEKCMGALATHVYYADQITDMVLVLMDRLQPGRSSSVASLPPGYEPETNEDGVPASPSAAHLPGTQSPSGAHVSSKTLRISALRVIKAIIEVANPKTNGGGNRDLSRNRVPMTVWEGTQWLLREPDELVRRAYVDALVTWLDRETTPADSRAHDELAARQRQPVKGIAREPSHGRRVVSTASARERQPRERRCRVLPLLHLAAYDSALQFLDSDGDMALIHGLLARLVVRLGVNAARYGIPMIYRLQEDVQALEQPVHKVRVAALCHGYFWTLAERFGFESSVGGRAIQNEIARRRNKGFWVKGVPGPAGQAPGRGGARPAWDVGALEKESLLPFDDRASLVQGIAESYQESGVSPPGSPAGPPGRAVSNPVPSTSASSMPPGECSPELPGTFRESMLSEWSREGAVAALAESRAESINGSKTGTTGTKQNLLGVQAAGASGGSHVASPYSSVHRLRPHSSQAPGERLDSLSRARRTSARRGVSPSPSPSSRGGVALVQQLKMMLSGGSTRHVAGMHGAEDDSDESMVSYEGSGSERSASPTTRGEQRAAAAAAGGLLGRSPSTSGSFKGPLKSNSIFNGEAGIPGEGQGDEDVPPVPPLPKLSALTARGGLEQGVGVGVGGGAEPDDGGTASRARMGSRGGESATTGCPRPRSGSSRGMDLQELLRGIDSRAGDGSLGSLTKPPY